MTAHETHNAIDGGIFFSDVIQGQDIVVRLPPEIPPALGGLPRATPSFTGRSEDLAVLLDVLEHRSPDVVLVSTVDGMGGVGKTELAVQAARQALAAGWFSGGVLFVDMLGYDPEPTGRLDAGQALSGFLRALNVPAEHLPSAVQDRSRLFRSLLAAYAEEGRRVLVVVDNVSDPGQALPLLPTDGSTAAMVTSRESLAGLNARLLSLSPLPRNEAIGLLRRVLTLRDADDTRIDEDPGSAAEIARLCGGLPLALQIVAALLAENPRRPLSAMARDLSDASTRLDEIAYPGRAVEAAFDLSYRRLDPGVAQAFRLLSVNPGPDLSTAAAAVLLDGSPRTAQRGLETLARAHLVDSGAVYGRWRMHDLIRLHATRLGDRESVRDRRDDALTRLLDHYLRTAHAANAHMDAQIPDPAALGFPDRTAALDWLDTEYRNLTAATHTAAAAHAEVARDLPRAVWDFLLLRRHFDDWIALAGVAASAARSLGDSGGLARALTDLGIAHAEMRNHEQAVTALRDAVEMYHGLEDPHGESIALNNLGNALRYMRRFEEVITATEAAVEVARRAGNRRGEALALISLGLGLVEVRRFEDAVDAHRKGADIYGELDDNRGQAMALTNLGIALQEAGRPVEAVPAHEAAVRRFRGAVDRHGEASALNNLGLALRESQRTEAAIEAHEAAIEIFRELKDREGEGRALDNLGLALQEAHRFAEAAAAHRRDLEICRDGADLYGEGVALTNLGLALAGLGLLDEAVGSHRAAIAVFRDIGDAHGESSARSNLNEALSQARDD